MLTMFKPIAAIGAVALLAVATPTLAAARVARSPATSAAFVSVLHRAGAPVVGNGRGGDGFLYGTDFLSASSGWAVGFSCPGCSTGFEKTLIERWNGTGWARVPSPDPSPIEGLFSVSAVSSTDAWAVGVYVKGHGTAARFHPLITHWNGTRWALVPSPVARHSRTASIVVLTSVSATSADNAWAVGYDCVRRCLLSGEIDRPLIMHWNGTAWSRIHGLIPGTFGGSSILSSVTATSATSAWAVGSFRIGSRTRTLILHWGGSLWYAVPSSNAGSHDAQLSAVAASSAGNAWAVGSFCPRLCGMFKRPSHSLILHWNGTRWLRVSSPNPSALSTTLSAVTVTSARSAWAVGDFCARRCAPTGYSSEVDRTFVLRWNGASWTRVANPHPGVASQLTDVSGPVPRRAWAVGYTCASACRRNPIIVPVIMRWNGASWELQRPAH